MARLFNKLGGKLPDSFTQLARNLSWLIVLKLLQRIAGFIAVYFVVRALNKEVYGHYQLLISILATFSVFSLPQTNNTIAQSVARGHLGTFRLILPYGFYSSLLGSCILLMIAGWYVWIKNDYQMAAGFTFIAVFFPFSIGLRQWRAVKTGLEDFPSLAKWEGGGVVLTQATIVIGVLLYPGTFLIPLFCVLAFPAFLNLFQTKQTYRKISTEEIVEKGSLRHGIETSFYGLFTVLSTQSEKLMLFFFLSPEALAMFAVAEKIPELFRNVVQEIAAVLAPRFARHRGYTSALDRKIDWFSGISFILIALVAFTILPWLFNFLFGEVYRDAIPFTIAIMCSVAVGNAAVLRIRFIRSQLDAKSMGSINFTLALVRIFTAAVFVPLWGLTGAVLSVFVMRFMSVIVVQIIIRKRYLLS